MGMNNCPDETAIVDLAVVRRKIIERLRSDGRFCALDAALIRAFDQPVRTLATNTQVRNAFWSVYRNGDTRRMRDKGRDAGIVFVTGNDGRLSNVVSMETYKDARSADTEPDAS